MSDLLERAELLALGPSDVLIVNLPDRVSESQAHEIHERLQHHLPDRKILIFEDGFGLRIEPAEAGS